VTITSDMPNWQYTPGTSYNMSVTVAGEGRPLFGLGFEALNSNGQSVGTLTPGTGTQIKTATIQGNVRQNIVHTTNGGNSNGSHTFSFTWSAPATNVGTITFYAAGNAANANGQKSGDHIYTTSQAAEPDGTITILESVNNESVSVSVFPNPAENLMTVEFSLRKASDVRIEVLSMRGSVVMTAAESFFQPGSHLLGVDITALPVGPYLILAAFSGEKTIKRINKV
jgi:hypothetical protein